MSDLLKQGVDAFNAGNKQAARNLFTEAVKQSPDDERAWGWLYNVCQNDQERILCLKHMLRINPKNEKASKILDGLMILEPPLEMPGMHEVNSSQHAEQQPNATSQLQSRLRNLFSHKKGLAVISIIGFAIICMVVFLFNILPFIAKLNAPPTSTIIPTLSLRLLAPTSIQKTRSPFATRVVSTPQPTSTKIKTPQTSTPKPTATFSFFEQTQVIGPIADTARDESYSVEVTLKNLKWSRGEDYSKPKSGNIFMIVDVQIKNLGPSPMRYAGMNSFKVLDSNGRLLDDTYNSIITDCHFEIVDLISGGNSEGCFLFEVPTSGKIEFIYAPYQYEALSPGRYMSFILR